jgi:hypothetical protein
MYLVLSAFTSSPISLVATTKASAFFFTVCTFPPNILTYLVNTDQNLKDIMEPQETQKRAEGPHEANDWTKASSYYRNTAPENSE